MFADAAPTDADPISELIGAVIFIGFLIGWALIHANKKEIANYFKTKATSAGALPWLILLAFIIGMMAGSIFLPSPRYKVVNAYGVIMDCWTGKLKTPAYAQ